MGANPYCYFTPYQAGICSDGRPSEIFFAGYSWD